MRIVIQGSVGNARIQIDPINEDFSFKKELTTRLNHVIPKINLPFNLFVRH